MTELVGVLIVILLMGIVSLPVLIAIAEILKRK